MVAKSNRIEISDRQRYCTEIRFKLFCSILVVRNLLKKSRGHNIRKNTADKNE